MPVTRVLLAFLLGVGATVVAYRYGILDQAPVWFGWPGIETTVVAAPPTTVIAPGPGGDTTIVSTPPGGAVVTTGPAPVLTEGPGDVVAGVGGPIGPLNGEYAPNDYPFNGKDDYPKRRHRHGGYDKDKDEFYKEKGEFYRDRDELPPPVDVVVPDKDVGLANGSPLRVNIYRSEEGFEARCTGYKIVNRSRRVLMLSFDPRYGDPDGPVAKAAGTLLKPGETLAEDAFPVECVEFRSLFNEGYPYEGRRGRKPSGPMVKIEIEDCPHDNCAVAQF